MRGRADLLSRRAVAILHLFTVQQPVLGIADIAERLGMSRYATHRHVVTLVGFGFLEQAAERKYRLSRGCRWRRLGAPYLP
jgi:IclR family KDG regulon transcriptional repressor